jgi:hypothetical protein
MAVTRLSTSWLGYDLDSANLFFWDGKTYRPFEEAAGYAPATHSHAIADVSGLQDALDGKLSLGGGAMTGSLALPQITLGNPGETLDLTADANGVYVGGAKVRTDGNAPAGLLRSQQAFIVSGTWTRPAGIRTVLAHVWGGGGGGGGAQGGAAKGACGAGGGAGGFGWKLIDVSAIASAAVTIGTAGAAGARRAEPAALAPRRPSAAICRRPEA